MEGILRIVRQSEVDPRLDQEIKRGYCICYEKDLAFFSQTRSWHGSWPAWLVVIEKGREVIAHTGIVDRTISIGGRDVRIAGIQGVYVLPDHRGKGLADQVLNAAMREAERLEFDFGLLFCIPEIEKVYSRCGWQKLEGRRITRIDKDGSEVPIPGYNIVMYYPLGRRELLAGNINLKGNDW
ncbi:MAG: GNAT family N-acetyltransferase [Planctomycetota bacterium]